LHPAISKPLKDPQVNKAQSRAGKTPKSKDRLTAVPANDDQRGNEPGEASRRERIAVTAYYNAERRGFEGNNELDDWLDAEKSIDGVSAADAAAQLNPDADASEVIYPEDIDEWAERLDVTREQLRVAIRQVGSKVDDVARFLGNPDVR
jgi:hypothetical protein